MWEEEYPLPGYKSSTESYVVAQFIGLGVLSSWVLAGDIAAGPAIVAAVGAISIFFYFFYRREGAISTSANRRYFKRWLLLPISMLIIWAVGQFYPTVTATHIGDRTFLHMVEQTTPGPVTSVRGANWQMLLYPCMMMLSAVGLIAFTQSQYAISRILVVLTRSAMILAGIGLVGAIFRWKRILTYFQPAQENFFSVFPHGHQWAAFALFWMVVGFGVVFHINRRQTWKSLFAQNGGWLILGWLLLAASVYWTGAPVHRFLLGVGIGLLMLSTGLALAGKGRTGPKSVVIGVLLAVGGCALTGGSLLYFASEFTQAQSDGTRAPFGIPWETQTALWRDSWALFQQRPFFGWGTGSFAETFPFQQQVDLGNYYYLTPHSDLVHGLVEYGLIGMALWLAFPLTLMISFARLKSLRRLSHYLWGGATLLILLSIVSQPLSSPANFVCLWIGLAAAYKWSQSAEQAAQQAAPVLERFRPQKERRSKSKSHSRRRGGGGNSRQVRGKDKE